MIQHSGHEDPAIHRRKLDRDLRLLLLENEERPDDPFTLFNLGSLYHETGRPAEALPLLQRSLERSRPRASIVTKLHALIAGCLRQLQRPREALDACRAGLKQMPDDDELLFLSTLVERELGNTARAEATLVRLLSTPRVTSLVNGDDRARGYKARHNLAVIFEETGRTAEAEAQWRAAVIENPQFTAGWLRLGELYLKQRRWDELEESASGLSRCPAGAAKASAPARRGMVARDLKTAIFAPLAKGGPGEVPAAEGSSHLSAKPRISLCMIVKDEEATLGACLASVADLVDEMVVVDTGSTDRTRAIAIECGARVINFAWTDDFAAAPTRASSTPREIGSSGSTPMSSSTRRTARS